MITEIEFRELSKSDESPILEYKKEWYWNDSTPSKDMANKWGELLKDVISLSNGYLNYVGQSRYLVFGYSESDQTLHDINLSNIKRLSNIKLFKKHLLEKLERYTFPALLNLDIFILTIDGKDMLILKIPSPFHLTELRNELKTKTRTLDTGTVLVRKGQCSDEVRIASPSEIRELQTEFAEYKSSHQINKETIEDKIDKFERSIEKTVQLYINKNSGFSLEINYPIKVKNWKEGVVFEVFKLTDAFGSFREFIYLHSDSNQSKTLGYIKQNNLIEILNKSIILTDKPKIKDVEKRKENIKSIFGTSFVYFIDEFGYEFLYKDCILDYHEYNLPIYIDSLYDEDERKDLSAFNKLKEWFYSDSQPLFVIKGHGGIGKTTLAKQFLDCIFKENKNSGILFIDSKEIIDELARNAGPNKKIEDVYDFYEAQVAVGNEENSKFSKELLKLSMDNGSIIIVLDGIDEVIAKLGSRFDVDSFISSVSTEYTSDLNRTKILITCRDHFWNDIGKNILVPEITLKAFNETLAEEFFVKSLNSDDKKIRKALEIGRNLAIEDPENEGVSSELVFIPFLLDMISYLIKTKHEDFSSHTSLDSNILSQKNHTDFLIASICNREVTKLETLDINKQVKLFMEISARKENGISLYDIKSVLNSITDSIVDDQLIEKIKGHPLLICSENTLSFRYDVFNIYFKTLFLVSFFKDMDVNKLDERTASIIKGYIKYDSSFTEELCRRIQFDDDLVIFCITIIEFLSKSAEQKKETIVSAVLVFLLCALQKSEGYKLNTEKRTDLIEKLFSDGTQITGLCLIDIFGEGNDRPIFDFRGKQLTNCSFDNFEYFWECLMDEKTRFRYSFFRTLEPRDGIKIKTWSNLFSEGCDVSSIQHLISKKESEIRSNAKIVRDDLIKIFRLFYERGNFYPRKQGHIRSKVFTSKLLPILLAKKVIKEFRDPKKPTMEQYVVSDEYKSVISYIEQGSHCVELFKLADELST